MNLRYPIAPTVLTFLTLVSPLSSQAGPIDAPIPAGNDYLMTVPGATFVSSIAGNITFEGNPSACGSPCLNGSDMVVNRDVEAVTPTPDVPGSLEGTIQARLTQLWWKSVAPVTVCGFGGCLGPFDVFANLDPSQPSTGELFLWNTNGEGSSSTSEGHFVNPTVFGGFSLFDFFLDYTCAPAGSGATPTPCGGPQELLFYLNNDHGSFSPVSSWNDPDDPGTGGSFWAGEVQACTFTSDACLLADPVGRGAVPEPGSVMLLMTAIAVCTFALRKKSGKRVTPATS